MILDVDRLHFKMFR